MERLSYTSSSGLITTAKSFASKHPKKKFIYHQTKLQPLQAHTHIQIKGFNEEILIRPNSSSTPPARSHRIPPHKRVYMCPFPFTHLLHARAINSLFSLSLPSLASHSRARISSSQQYSRRLRAEELFYTSTHTSPLSSSTAKRTRRATTHAYLVVSRCVRGPFWALVHRCVLKSYSIPVDLSVVSKLSVKCAGVLGSCSYRSDCLSRPVCVFCFFFLPSFSCARRITAQCVKMCPSSTDIPIGG